MSRLTTQKEREMAKKEPVIKGIVPSNTASTPNSPPPKKSSQGKNRGS